MIFESKPRIGVTGPDSGGWPAWVMTRIAIQRAGGRAVRITPSRPHSIDDLDGLVIGGGADVDPALYNEQHVLPQIRKEKRQSRRSTEDFFISVLVWLLRRFFSSPWHQIGDKERDRLESRLIAEAVEHRLPILGICRGMQLLNVHFGGTLYQDISDFYEETPQLRTILPKKKVEIEPCSRLHQVLGVTLARVNSLHKQSVKDLGSGLHLSAREPNGVVQAIEHRAYPYILGVQWHPEFLPHDSRQSLLFRELVHHAQAKKSLVPEPSTS